MTLSLIKLDQKEAVGIESAPPEMEGLAAGE